MSCVLLTYYVAVITIFVCSPNQIECCTESTNDINTLMAANPNFKSDPCYIKWKSDQDAKVDELLLRQEELQVSATEYNRNTMEHETIRLANRQKRYTSHYNESRSRSNVSSGQIMGIVILSISIVIICCCSGCKLICCNDDNETSTPRTYVLQENQTHTQIQSTSVMFTNAFENNDNTNCSRLIAGLPSRANESNDNQNYRSIFTGSPSRTNVPPMASRQSSLPSYEEAVKIHTTPLKE